MYRLRFRFPLCLLALLTIGLSPANAKSLTVDGRRLMDKYGCSHCHLVNGKGGTVAPPLDGIKNFRNTDYVLQRIGQTGNVVGDTGALPESLMNHVAVKAADRQAIADYVMALPARPFSGSSHGSTPTAATVPPGSQFIPLPMSEETARGSHVFKEGGCFACHSIGSIGGHIGPNLSGVGARRSRDYIERVITVGATLVPRPGSSSKRAMHAQDVCGKHLKELVDFLMTLPPVPAEKH